MIDERYQRESREQIECALRMLLVVYEGERVRVIVEDPTDQARPLIYFGRLGGRDNVGFMLSFPGADLPLRLRQPKQKAQIMIDYEHLLDIRLEVVTKPPTLEKRIEQAAAHATSSERAGQLDHATEKWRYVCELNVDGMRWSKNEDQRENYARAAQAALAQVARLETAKL